MYLALTAVKNNASIRLHFMQNPDGVVAESSDDFIYVYPERAFATTIGKSIISVNILLFTLAFLI